MIDREFHFHAAGAAATALWVVCVGVWVVSWVIDEVYLAGGAVILSAAAGTMSARSFLARHHEEIKTAMVVTGRSGRVTQIGR